MEDPFYLDPAIIRADITGRREGLLLTLLVSLCHVRLRSGKVMVAISENGELSRMLGY